MADIRVWLEQRAREDQRLYELYGMPLEKEHKGKCLAIGPNGETILGESDVEVLEQAITRFGSGNFALVRLGQKTFGQWLSFAR